MKIITPVLFALVFSFGTGYAGDGPKKKQSDKYCAKMKDGMLRVMLKDEPITSTIVLADGTQIKMDGTVIKKDGTVYNLKEGECVDKDGNVDAPSKGKK